MEKWKDRKDFIFSLICLVESRKVEEMKKMSFNKFTHIPLLKNDVQLKQKQKKTQRTTFKKKKKGQHPEEENKKEDAPA